MDEPKFPKFVEEIIEKDSGFSFSLIAESSSSSLADGLGVNVIDLSLNKDLNDNHKPPSIKSSNNLLDVNTNRLNLDNNVVTPLSADDFHIGQCINYGAYGIVCECTNTVSGEKFACKLYGYSPCNTMLPSVPSIENEQKNLLRLQGIDGVVQLVGTFMDTKSGLMPSNSYTCDGKKIQKYRPGCSYPVTVTELLPGKELLHYFEEKEVPEDVARIIFRRLIIIVMEIHARGVIHRDLKPENMVFSSASVSGGNYDYKVIDFGAAIIIPPPNDSNNQNRVILDGAIGTINYQAPESIHKNEYSFATDIWQAGVILFVMLYGYMPFSVKSYLPGPLSDQVIAHIFDTSTRNCNYLTILEKRACSMEAKDLLARIFKIDPNNRITGKEILAHPWLTMTE